MDKSKKSKVWCGKYVAVSRNSAAADLQAIEPGYLNLLVGILDKWDGKRQECMESTWGQGCRIASEEVKKLRKGQTDTQNAAVENDVGQEEMEGQKVGMVLEGPPDKKKLKD